MLPSFGRISLLIWQNSQLLPYTVSVKPGSILSLCPHVGNFSTMKLGIFSIMRYLRFRDASELPNFDNYTVFLTNGPIPASFCLFSFFSCYNFNTNWKKCRWCAWDLIPGPQDGRRRWNHAAMAATINILLIDVNLFVVGSFKEKFNFRTKKYKLKMVCFKNISKSNISIRNNWPMGGQGLTAANHNYFLKSNNLLGFLCKGIALF